MTEQPAIALTSAITIGSIAAMAISSPVVHGGDVFTEKQEERSRE